MMTLAISVLWMIPWVVIGAADGVGYMRTRQMPVLIQAVGAVVILFVSVIELLTFMARISSSGSYWVWEIMRWLIWGARFVGYAVFVCGYCMERFRKAEAKAGFPVVK